MTLYTDHDPNCCAWLRELVRAECLPSGDVLCADIATLTHEQLTPYDTIHHFAGIGGWPYALTLAGWPADRPVWTASCPCQPLSCAGQRKGHADRRHLWPALYRLIAERRPATIFGEQVAGVDGREWLAGVRADLEGIGYAVGASDLCAAGVGAPHIRQRLYWVADAQHAERWPEHVPGEHECDRHDNRRAQTHSEPGACCEVCGLAHHERPRLEEWSGEPGNAGQEYTPVERSGDAGGVEHAARDGRGERGAEPSGGSAEPRCEPSGVGNAELHGCYASTIGCGINESKGKSGLLKPQGSDSPWSSCDLIPCRDLWPGGTRKTRRIEPGTFPLAHGVPARVGRLRGYGNAIVPQVGALFIRAFLDA